MKARQSIWAKKFFTDRNKGRKLLNQLRENEQFDNKLIKTDFGYFSKIS